MRYSIAALAGGLAVACLVLSSQTLRAQGRIITQFPYSQSFAFVPGGTSTTPSGPIGAAVFPSTNVDGGEFTVDAGTSSVMVNGSTTGLNNNLGAGGMLRIQTSGSAAPSTSQGLMLHCSFASQDAASISIGWTKVTNGTSTRANELRIAASIDAGPFNDLASAAFDNSATAQSGTLVAEIPTTMHGSASVRFRISSINVSGTGTHPRVIVDNIAIAELADAPLPVELASFAAHYRDGRVEVVWATASEMNNAGFEVQRALASDSIFTPLASYLTHFGLMGLGTSAMGRGYRFDDELDGSLMNDGTILLYRLVDIDVDGTRNEHASQTVRVTSTEHIDAEATIVRLRLEAVTPLPVVGHLVVRWTQAFDEAVSITIVNVAGERVFARASRVERAGSHEDVAPVAALASGVYTLVVRSTSAERTRAFVVAR